MLGLQPGRAGTEQGAVGGAAPAAALPALVLLQVAVQGRRELLLPPRGLDVGWGTMGRSAGQGFFVGGDGAGVPRAAREKEETQQRTPSTGASQHPTTGAPQHLSTGASLCPVNQSHPCAPSTGTSQHPSTGASQHPINPINWSIPEHDGHMCAGDGTWAGFARPGSREEHVSRFPAPGKRGAIQEGGHRPSDLATRQRRPVPTEFMNPSPKKKKGSLAWQPRRTAASGIKGYNRRCE